MSTAALWLRRVVVGFGRFWWDFLVGDTPELFVAVVSILIAITLLSEVGHQHHLSVIVLPLMVVGALALSVRRALKR